jgi:hypothetical protein
MEITKLPKDTRHSWLIAVLAATLLASITYSSYSYGSLRRHSLNMFTTPEPQTSLQTQPAASSATTRIEP